MVSCSQSMISWLQQMKFQGLSQTHATKISSDLVVFEADTEYLKLVMLIIIFSLKITLDVTSLK